MSDFTLDHNCPFLACTPYVTIVMPVYNGAAFVAEAIESILRQTLADFEFIIIDDGSNDGSVDIINSYKDLRIHLLRNESNLGVSESLNKGFNLARGVYIARMDSDDISLPERLERQVAFMEAHPEIGICGTWVEILGGTGRQIYRYPSDPDTIKCMHLFGPALAHPSVMVRRNLLETLGHVYDPSFKRAQDFELWVRAASLTSIANLEEVLVRYRLHHQQVGRCCYEEQADYAGNVRLSQLKKLGVYPSDEEFALHQSISQWRFENSRMFIDNTEQWLVKLLKANKEASVYPETSFSAVLGERWFEVCDAATELGLWLFAKFNSSPLEVAGNLPWSRRVRFFTNTLLSRRRGKWFTCQDSRS